MRVRHTFPSGNGLAHFQAVQCIKGPVDKMATMQQQKYHRTSYLIFTLAIVTFLSVGPGCASHMYRVSNLPPEFAAPAALDLESLNLSGLANNSVSVEVIQPGDVLDVSIVTDYTKLDTTTTPVRVGDDGMVIVPLVGKVSVGGLEVARAEQAINAESVARGIFRNPCITVTMNQYRTRKVTVMGAVNEPGTHELPRGSTSLMAALVAAEGLSEEAGTEVEIRHTDSRQALLNTPPSSHMADDAEGHASLASYQQTVPGVMTPNVTKVDLSAAAAGGVQVPELNDGDVVHVAKRTLPPVYVIGLVQKPGEYEFPTRQELRVLDALALAGGVSNSVAEDVIVIRKVEGGAEPVRIAVSLQAAKNGSDNLALAPGDVVTVERTPATVAIDIIHTFVRVSFGSSLSWF